MGLELNFATSLMEMSVNFSGDFTPEVRGTFRHRASVFLCITFRGFLPLKFSYLSHQP